MGLVVAVVVAVMLFVMVCGVNAKGQCTTKYDVCVNVTDSRKTCFGNRLLLLVQKGNHCRVEELLTTQIQDASYYVTFSENAGAGKRRGYTALLWAAELNDSSMVEILVDYDSNVDHQSSIGWSALLLLAEKGNLDSVQLLLNHSADPDIKTENGLTPLILAAWNKFYSIVKALLEKKADPDITTPHSNYSALYLAARNGDMEVTKTLLDHNCSINIQTSWGVSPLLVATYWGHVELVKHLLKNGGDPNLQQVEGFTVLHKAVYYNYPDIVDAVLRPPEIVDGVLIRPEIDVNIMSNTGNTALMLAVKEGHSRLITRLLDASADLNLQDETNRTVMHWAARKRNVEVMKQLLGNEGCPADLTIQDSSGNTALDIARFTTKTEIIKILEDKAASCN